MRIKIIIPLCSVLLGFHSVSFGAEPISEWEKRACPQCFHEYVKYSYRVLLPEGMSAALKKYSPTFRIFGLEDYVEELRLKLQPWSTNLISYSAVFRDFNGDGRFDAAVMGEYREESLGGDQNHSNPSNSNLPSDNTHTFAVLAIISQGTTNYTVGEVTKISISKEVSAYLSLSSPGKISEIGVDDKDNPITSKDVFESKNYGIRLNEGVGVNVFHWDHKLNWFREFLTGGL